MMFGNFMSKHDQLISEKLGYVFEVDINKQITDVSEQYLLNMERKAFRTRRKKNQKELKLSNRENIKKLKLLNMETAYIAGGYRTAERKIRKRYF